jgi:hypothetical protein
MSARLLAISAQAPCRFWGRVRQLLTNWDAVRDAAHLFTIALGWRVLVRTRSELACQLYCLNTLRAVGAGSKLPVWGHQVLRTGGV